MPETDQDELYRLAIAEHGPAIGRLLRAYEADPELRRDLLQEIHVGLWRSFAVFDRRCSLRTWAYRVAHNIASSHVARRMRGGKQVSLDALAELPDGGNVEQTASEKQMLEKLTAMIRTLEQPDRQIILLYLEDMDARRDCRDHRPQARQHRHQDSSHQIAAGAALSGREAGMSDLKTIWKTQEMEYTPMALEDIRTQAGRLHSNVHWRNIGEAVAAVMVLAAFSFYVWRFPDPLTRAGSVLIILGTLYVIWRLFTRGGTRGLPCNAAAASWTDYYRSELVRQRDMLKSVCAWYPGAVGTGLCAFPHGNGAYRAAGGRSARSNLRLFAAPWFS
ncbi:MAG: sigma-70 family RNA polymerase sigma factor [Rhizomicrobium sp.]